MNLLPAQPEQLEKSLRGQLAGEAFFDRYHRAFYSTDASIYSIEPLAVVLPRNRHDVIVTTQVAAQHGVPIIPRGAGTSLSGQSIGPGIVIDFSKYMNRIVELDAENGTARIQPGVVLEQLNQAAAPHGLQFGPDVATINRANLGGMIGNNSAGARSILHGKTVDHVIELEAVLSDGSLLHTAWLDADALAQRQRLPGREGQIHRQVAQIVETHRDEILARFPRVLRRVSGYNFDEFVPECRQRVPQPPSVRRVRQIEASRYPGCHFNLSKLLVGAEGSLATVTEALVHLVPLPKARGLLVLEFDSLADAIDAVGVVLKTSPSAIELFDKMILELAAENVQYRHYLDFVTGRPDSLILAEFSGDDLASVRQKVEAVAASLAGHRGLTHLLPTTDPELCQHIWDCRKAALPLLMGIPGYRKPIAFVEDTAVDPPRLPEFVARFRQIIDRAGTRGAFYGHASVGCLHIRPLINTRDPDDLKRMRRMLDEVAELVLEFGGAMSGEHGDGLARSWLNEKLFGPKLYQAFRQIKHVFDPAGLMNPGKVVDGPDPTEHLRLAPDNEPRQIETRLDFSRQGGFARAAELCHGAGVCRKRSSGTMCPSFMATGDEEHSTRGRANALRMVLSGVLPFDELFSPRLYHTFELCLQCKGCKAECPSNVDVAKLKSEFLYQYQRRRGTPLATRLMARVGWLNRLGAAGAPLTNWLASLPGAAWLAQQLAGIDRRRPLPTFERHHFRRWFDRHVASRNSTSPASHAAQAAIRRPADRGPIVLLDDCLTSYCEPNVNRSAVELLEAAGFEVHCARLGCCGRPFISKGLLDEARRLAASNLQRLQPWIERGATIVGCEPSCVLTLADDYLDLVPGELAQKVAASACLIDDFLADPAIELPLRPTASPSSPAGHANGATAPAPDAASAADASADMATPTPATAQADHAATTPLPIVLHGHCHQKALVGVGGSAALLRRIPGANVEVLDSGCCGMAGSFGYEHYDLSMQIARRVLLPAIEQRPEARIAAPGFSCRHQIQHGSGRTARHPVEIVAEHLDRR